MSNSHFRAYPLGSFEVVYRIHCSVSRGFHLRWPDSRESIRRFARIAWFLRIVSGFLNFIDLLMGLFRGAVFGHGGGALKQPIKQPTETPTSTLALMGRFPSLMGRFPTLMGHFTDFVLRGRFTSWKSTGKQPINQRRGIKRFLRTEPQVFANRASEG